MKRRIFWAAGGALLVAAAALLAAIVWRQPAKPSMDPNNAALVALGQSTYAQNCAACHGQNLQGQPDWQIRLPNGLLPAPPHDESGHTWHHPDDVLFDLTKKGLVPPNAPDGYETAMPAYEDILTDAEIAAVLAYIKSTWPPNVQKRQRRLTEQSQP